MADKEEEKIEWNEEILVPLDGLKLDGDKKEDDNYGDWGLVDLKGWDNPKIDPEEYKRIKEERDRLLREKEKLETKTKAIQDQNARLAAEKAAEEERRRQLEEAENRRQYEEWKKQREKEKSTSKSGEVSKPKAEHEPSTGGLGKSLIIALLVVFGIVSYKLYDKKNADLQAQLADKDKQIETLKKQEPTAQPAEPKVIVKTEYVKDPKTEQELAEAKKKIASLENKPKSRSTRQQQVPAQQAATTAVARQSAASKYQVGNYVSFGEYPYDANGTVRPIEWRVLANDGSKALLITKNGIDGVPYNKAYVSITWADSSIRKWLNNEFLNKAFTDEQQSKIKDSPIANNDNAKYNTRGGNATNDKLFLLSIEEANKYFKSDDDRKAYPTPYANLKTKDGGSCWWWLRSPGDFQDGAAGVDCVGDVYSRGYGVYNGKVAVRVALWLDLKNL